MNTNSENKSNKVGEARKQVQESIMEECRKIVNMTNADFEKEYENHKLDSLRVICALYSIDPVELMKLLYDHSARQSIKTLEAEFEQIYNEPLWIDDRSIVKVFCTPRGDTDKLATEVSIRGTKIYPPKGMLIGKITPIDNSFFVEFVGNDEKQTDTDKKDENAVKDSCVKPIGTVEIGYAGDWDFDDFTRELTRIETDYLGKTGEMDYYQFLAVLSHIRNMYEKYHKSEGLNNFKKMALIEVDRENLLAGIDGIKHALVETNDTDKCENCSLYDKCVSNTKNLCKVVFGDIAYNKHFEIAKE